MGSSLNERTRRSTSIGGRCQTIDPSSERWLCSFFKSPLSSFLYLAPIPSSPRAKGLCYFLLHLLLSPAMDSARPVAAVAAKSTPEMESAYAGRSAAPPVNYFSADFAIRLLLLLASSVAGLIVLATAKQTERIALPVSPFFVSRSAQFDHSPGLIFLLVALAAACGYAVATLVASAAAVRNPSPSTKLLFNLIVLDAIMAAVVAAAAGTGGGVAYIGLKGNSYVRWNKICGVYGIFCRHVGSAVGLALISAIALLLLVILSGYSLYRRAH